MKGFKVAAKKSRLQLHRDESLRKKRLAEEEAAKVYADFVESFESEEAGSKEFVRAGTAKDGNYVASKQERYLPPASQQQAKKTNVFDIEAAKEQIMPKLPLKRKKEPSQRELFLQELKQDQEAREARAAARKASVAGGGMAAGSGDGRRSMFDVVPDDPYAGVKGSFADADDHLTTNLYVGNLAPTLNEDYIARVFSVHGAIGSVKVMWPRTDEERARGRNSGFVQFMDRKGAERAKNSLDGTMHAERQIIVSWGKPVARPLVAMYPATVQTASGFSSAGGWSMTQAGAMVRGTAGMIGAPQKQYQLPAGAVNLTIVVKPPHEAAVMAAADKVAEFVKEDGWAIEQLILEREMGNALFDFLHDTTSPDHTYYRWRAYSLAQGDELQNFRTAKFQMYQNGPMWQPPACPIKHTETEEGSRIFSEGVAGNRMNGSKQTHQSGAKERGRARDRDRDEDREERARQRERDSDGRGRILDGQLSARQLDSLHGILRSLVVDRKSIEEGLMFCVDHSEAADEIVDALYESLTLPPSESTIEKKLARLYLVSDILHNSSAPFPKTARFRSLLQPKLATIMGSCREALMSMEGRMAAENIKAKVGRMLDVWDKWSLYPPHSLLAFRAAFTGVPYGVTCGCVTEMLGQDPAASLDGEELDMSMFDGVDDVAGASAESQSQQLSDLDGESMTTYADGVEEAD